jgi:hypothetical protein
MQSHERRAIEQAAMCIRNISLVQENCDRIVQEGAVQPLVGLVRYRDEKIQEQAVCIVQTLSATNAENKNLIVDEGGL